jgi:hypothetical protein
VEVINLIDEDEKEYPRESTIVIEDDEEEGEVSQRK